jgi:glycosyltransferase involved in cell wall biosynthesis
MKDLKRVAIVGVLWNLSISPSVINSIKMWIRNNYLVDFIAIGTDMPEDKPFPCFVDEKMNVYEVPMKKINVPILRPMLNLISLIKFAYSHCKNKKYECVIGFDPAGLTVATVLGILSNTPVVYHSLELRLSRYNKTLNQKLNKMLERWCNKLAVYTLIQDEARAKCLIEDNKITSEKVLIVPNTYLQEGEIAEIKNSYLREKFGISEDKKIILHVGGLNKIYMVEELIQSVPTWPENCILVLHGWVWKESKRADYFGFLKELAKQSGFDNNRIFFSTDVLPQEDLDKMVSSADIGVALYHNTDLNIYNMASGKLFQYLKYGLPVITIDFPNLIELVEDKRCGICINDENEIGDAISKILSDYGVFSSNALKCFEEKYEFSRYYQNVIENIRNLGNKKTSDQKKGLYFHGFNSNKN